MVLTGGWARVAIAALLLVAVVPSVTATGAQPVDSPADTERLQRLSLGGSTGVAMPPTQQTANNSTIQHTNPEDSDEEGELDAVQNWLTGRMAETLINCSQRTSVSEEIACSRLDEEYPEWVSNYITTARDTDGTGDDRRGRQFNETQQTHEEYRDAVQEFSETRQAYSEARENGDRERARELARELSETATRVNETGGTLTEQFERLEASTGINFGPAIRNTREVAENATSIAATVRQREFVATSLTVSANRSAIAFDDPVRISGQLRANDSAIATRSVRIVVGTRTYTVRTDADGRFDLVYRPTLLPQATESLTIAYRPAPSSLYERSEAAVNVNVSGTPSELSATLSETTAVYGETVRAEGQLRAAGRAVPNVPLRIAFAGTATRVRTDSEGEYNAGVGVTPAVSDGAQTVTIRVGLRDRAIEQTTETRAVTIESSSTNITLRATDVTSDRARITVGLATESGREVSGETLQLTVANGTRRTVTTDETGAATAALDLTNRTGNVTITAAYRPSGGNLAPTTERLRIAVPDEETAATGAQTEGPGGSGGSSGPGAVSPEWAGAVVGIVALFVGGVIVAARAFGVRPTDVLARFPGGVLGALGADTEQSDGGRDEADEAPGGSSTAAEDAEITEGEPPVIDDAEALLDEGRTDEAVITIYEAVRAELVDTYELLPGLTHWELLDRLQSSGGEQVGESVLGLTTAYERAAYAPDTVGADEATAALETAKRLLSQTDQFL